MNDNKNSSGDLIQELQRQLNIDTGLIQNESLSYEKVRDSLALRINSLLKENRSLLFASLYRIDVAEKDVKAALNDSSTSLVLAELILQKLNEKLYWRKKYPKPNNDSID